MTAMTSDRGDVGDVGNLDHPIFQLPDYQITQLPNLISGEIFHNP
jgi:hypothetical protein